MNTRRLRLPAALAALLLSVMAFAAPPARAIDIAFRSFSPSAAIGPPADQYAAKLSSISGTVLGAAGQVNFVRLSPTPAVPAAFGGSILRAVAAGRAGGGFDAAYISGGDLNATWGFLYNSGVPLGPTFDEYLGFLFGRVLDNGGSGVELLQDILDRSGRNVVAVPVVGSSEQVSGYFRLPVGNVPGSNGIGIEGLCQQNWRLRYLPPAENVLNVACDKLVAAGKIPVKNLRFIAAVPGGGSLIDGVIAGQLEGFEFATPLDDVSQLVTPAGNPGTVGLRYLHFPGWQQQFLITYMIVNRQVWDSLTAAQQTLVRSVGREHVLTSYADNVRQMGGALATLLSLNRADGNPANDMVLAAWPKKDLEILADATITFLNARINDTALDAVDRMDYAQILEALRRYVRANDAYWDLRQVPTRLRFEDWRSAAGEPWEARGR